MPTETACDTVDVPALSVALAVKAMFVPAGALLHVSSQ